jgi:hypothetical protein
MERAAAHLKFACCIAEWQIKCREISRFSTTANY